MTASELFRNCYSGDRKACQTFHTLYYLMPRLEHYLNEMTEVPNLITPLTQPEKPGFNAYLDHFMAQKEMIEVVAGNPQPQPQPSLPVSLRLKSTIGFRNVMEKYLKSLDEQIDQLEKECQVRDLAYSPN